MEWVSFIVLSKKIKQQLVLIVVIKLNYYWILIFVLICVEYEHRNSMIFFFPNNSILKNLPQTLSSFDVQRLWLRSETRRKRMQTPSQCFYLWSLRLEVRLLFAWRSERMKDKIMNYNNRQMTNVLCEVYFPIRRKNVLLTDFQRDWQFIESHWKGNIDIILML